MNHLKAAKIVSTFISTHPRPKFITRKTVVTVIFGQDIIYQDFVDDMGCRYCETKVNLSQHPCYECMFGEGHNTTYPKFRFSKSKLYEIDLQLSKNKHL